MVVATDLKAAVQGSVVPVAVSGLDTVDAGQLKVCGTAGSSDQFIQFNFAGVVYNLTSPTNPIVEYTNNGTYIVGNYLTPDPTAAEIRMGFMNINGTTGTAGDSVYVVLPGHRMNLQIFVTCTLTTYDPVGGYIAGSFKGPGNDSLTISGSFKVKRTDLGPGQGRPSGVTSLQ
jgi:hypothetical protein